MSKIVATENYEIFKKHECNRDIDKNNLKKIVFSIQTNNMLQFRPILVDSDMRVIDGQHRLEAAKILNLPIYYQINEETKPSDIVLLNENQKKWGIEQYINYYSGEGHIELGKLMDFLKQRKISFNLFGNLYNGSRKHLEKRVKKGIFNFKEEVNVSEFDELLTKIEIACNKIKAIIFGKKAFINTRTFTCALGRFIRNDEVEFDLFINKLVIKSSAIKQCASREDYYYMFKNIYNWKNYNPIE